MLSKSRPTTSLPGRAGSEWLVRCAAPLARLFCGVKEGGAWLDDRLAVDVAVDVASEGEDGCGSASMPANV